MARVTKIVVAWFLAMLHPLVSLSILFGWLFPTFSVLYLVLLVATLMSWLIWGQCVLSTWEYRLRKQLAPNMEDYEYGYIHYHMRHWFKNPPSLQFIKVTGYIFLISSIIIWIINYLVDGGVIQYSYGYN